jgi:hypothetical protein
MRLPCVTEVEAFLREWLGGDPAVRSPVAVDDPVPR